MSRRSRLALSFGIAAVVIAAAAVALSSRDTAAPDAAQPGEAIPMARDGGVPFQTTSPLYAADWLKSDEAQCPEGTRLRGAPPPEGNEIWCARPDGTRHGQHIHWQSNGRKAFERRYKNGTLHGYWAEWQISGKPWTVGQYNEGRRHGRWMRWDTDHTVRVTHYDDGVRLGRKVIDETDLADPPEG